MFKPSVFLQMVETNKLDKEKVEKDKIRERIEFCENTIRNLITKKSVYRYLPINIASHECVDMTLVEIKTATQKILDKENIDDTSEYFIESNKCSGMFAGFLINIRNKIIEEKEEEKEEKVKENNYVNEFNDPIFDNLCNDMDDMDDLV